MRRIGHVSAALLGALCLAGAAQGETLSVGILPTTLSLPLARDRSSNPGLVPIVATTTWSLNLGRTSLTLDAYFSSASVALAHTASSNPVDIPSSRVEASINGSALAPFTNTVTFGGGGAGRRVFSQTISVLTLTGLRADVIALNINLSGLAVPADTYSGTLRFRAQASP